ncbi:DUF2631 domain-containing protein [Glycomyces sp. L485]|uniref:DUF2631 domain-containing protein n=1 Tax=Glycomyces sp. L485 TaxID=2909235 RepID=UPI001F4BBEC6|nr:DUF2631 domain-containing protein [Glycomyces sp. L485]MCH7230470.1 DUF2631 domain-containing protein [Glycomyces sp. L485]
MAAEEQILAPDQRKPTSRKAMYSALLIGAAILLTFLFGNHVGRVEDVFIVLSAAALVAVVAVDAVMRKRGLR